MTQDVAAARVLADKLAVERSEMVGTGRSKDRRMASDRREAARAIRSLLARVAALEEGMRPVTMQDVRLRVGEGTLSAVDVLAGVNAELDARRSRADFFADRANKSPAADLQKMQNSDQSSGNPGQLNDSQKGGGA